MCHVAEQISVEANRAVHVGDDEGADKGGANALGINCWCGTNTFFKFFVISVIFKSLDLFFRFISRLWGKDVQTFSDIQDRILVSEH